MSLADCLTKYNIPTSVANLIQRLTGVYINAPYNMTIEEAARTATRDVMNETLNQRGRIVNQIKTQLKQDTLYQTNEEALVHELNLLRPAVKVGEDVHIGRIKDNHYDVRADANIDFNGVDGMVTPDGEFMDRKQAFEWMKAGDKGIFNAYLNDPENKKDWSVPSQHTRRGEIESMAYQRAAGIRGQVFFQRQDADAQAKMDKKWAAFTANKTSDGKILGAPEWVKTDKDLRKMERELRKYLNEGISGRYWYEDSGRAVLELVDDNPSDAIKFIKLLAIYSPQANVDVNTLFAIKAWNHYKNGGASEDLKVKTELQDNKARDVLYDNKHFDGRKTGSFYANLIHEVIVMHPEIMEDLKLDSTLMETLGKPATIDMWMYRAFGFRSESAGDDKGNGHYSFAENYTRKLTAKLNLNLQEGEPRWLPHQVQAAIWTAMKSRYEIGHVKYKTIAESIKKGLTTIVDGKKVYPSDVKGRTEHQMIWMKHAKAVTSAEATAAAEAGAASYEDYISRMTETITVEAIPSPELKHPILNAPASVKRMFTAEAKRLIVDEDGNDTLAALLKVPINRIDYGSGLYLGYLTPNMLVRLTPDKGDGSYDRNAIRQYTRALQILFKQDAVPWFRPDPMAMSSQNARDAQQFRVTKNGRTVSGSKFDTLAEVMAFRDEKISGSIKEMKGGKNKGQFNVDGKFYSSLDEATKAAEALYSVQGGKFARSVELTFSEDFTQDSLKSVVDLSIAEFGEDVGFTQTSPNTVMITNYRDDVSGVPFVDDDVWGQQLFEFSDKNAVDLGISEIKKGYSEGEYGYYHDWKNDPEGRQFYEDSDEQRHANDRQEFDNERGFTLRQDVQEWIRSRQGSFEKLLEEYSEENLARKQVEAEQAGLFFQENQVHNQEQDQQEQDQLGFYSALTKAAHDIKQNSLPAKSWVNALKKLPNVKQQEIDAVGLQEWLDLQGEKVSKEDVIAFLDQGGVKIEEVTKGEVGFNEDAPALPPDSDLEVRQAPEDSGSEFEYGVVDQAEETTIGLGNTEEEAILDAYSGHPEYWESGSETKYQTYTLPGGENYREVLMTLPRSGNPDFTSPHWDEPNVIAHFRLDDRTVNGEKVLFVEEIQSDWSLEGRKKGFRGDEDAVRRQVEEEYQGLTQSQIDQMVEARLEMDTIPHAPFVQDSSWQNLTLKRIIRMAAEQGYDRVSWVTGEQTAERYSLDKQLDRIIWTKNGENDYSIVPVEKGAGATTESRLTKENISADEISEFVGKDIAEKIVNDGGVNGVLQGDDLKIEAKWARELYDKSVPNWMSKFGKKYGAKVERIEGQQSLPITDKMRSEVMQGQPLFQGKESSVVRGAIDLTKEGETIITFFKDKNLSTFLHEIGHYFLKDLQMTAEKDGVDKDLWAMAKEYLGVKDGQAITEDQHEIFARSFENYLREGRAPNRELKGVFGRFREWLTHLYKKAKDNNVEINNDIRYVFDRMLATEKEIDDVWLENSMVEMLDEVHDLDGMSDEQRREYAETLKLSKEQAYADVNKLKLKNLNERRKRARRQATSEVENDPIYAGLFFLKYGRLPTEPKGDTFGAGISIESMKSAFGEEIFKALKNIPGLYRKDGGVDVEQAMATMGIKDPGIFLYALGSIESKANMVEYRAEMLLKAEESQIDASEQAQNDLYEKQLFLESQFLAEKSGGKAVSNAALKTWAKSYVARQTLKNAKDTHRMLLAIAKQRRQALSAQRAGKVKEAFDLNEKARRNEALLREHIRVKETLPKMQRRWKRIVKSKTVHDDYRNQARRLANKFGLITTPVTINPDTEPLNLFLERKLQEKDPIDQSNPMFADWLTDIENSNYKEMSWGEIAEIDAAMTYLNGQGREALGLKKLSDGQEFEAAIESSLNTMGRVTRRKTNANKFSLKRQVSNSSRDFFANVDQLQFMFQRLDKYSHGTNSRMLWDRLVTANNRQLELSEEIHAKIDKYERILRDHANKSGSTFFTHVETPQLLLNDGDGWTFDKLVAVALNMGNHENILRFVEGYDIVTEQQAEAAAFIDDTMTAKEKKEAISAAKVDLGLQKMIEITAPLTTEEFNAVQGIIDTINSLWTRIDDVHFNLNNFHQVKVEPNELHLPAQIGRKIGTVNIPARPEMTLAGGYYAIKYDAELDPSGKMEAWNEKDEMLQSMDAIHQATKPRSGFLKARKDTGGKLPVKLSLNVLTQHLSDTIHYISHAETLHDINRIIKDERWAKEATSILGKDSYKMLERNINRVAAPEGEYKGVLDKKFNKQRILATSYILGWNVSVALKQPFSVGAVGFDVGFTNLAKGMLKMMAHPVQGYTSVNEMSAYMRNRSKVMDRELSAAMRKLNPNRKSLLGLDLEDVRNSGFAMIKMMDFATVYPAWNAAFIKAQNEGKSDQEAIMFADNTISFSQPTSRQIDLSSLQGSTKGIHRIFTMFSTFTMKYNNRKRFFYNKWREGEMSTGEYMYHNAIEAFATPLLMATLISLIRDKKVPDDEELLADLIRYQFIGMPYATDVANLVINGITGSYQRKLGDSPVFEGGKLAANVVIDTGKFLADSNDPKKQSKALWSMAHVASYAAGAPVSVVAEKMVKGAGQMRRGKGDALNLFIPQYKK